MILDSAKEKGSSKLGGSHKFIGNVDGNPVRLEERGSNG